MRIRKKPHLRISIAVALLGLCPPWAQAADFAARCNLLTNQANVMVEFQDREVMTDESRTVQALNEMSGKLVGGPSNILGLTHAKPSFQMNVMVRAITNEKGQACAIPNIKLTLGFSAFVVYLARDLTDGCRREVIRAHEQEHVDTWKSHLRASAQMLPGVLRRELGEMGEARIYDSREEAEAAVRTQATGLVTPWLARIAAAATEAQLAIDTPMSYTGVVNRLRACPGGARGGR